MSRKKRLPLLKPVQLDQAVGDSKQSLKHFECIVPFLNQDMLNNLAKQIIEREGIKGISPAHTEKKKSIFPGTLLIFPALYD